MIENIQLRPSKIEIDIKALEHNINCILRDKPGKLGIISVVKDQAYGHGALQVVDTLKKQGINRFAVATIDEAIELREKNIKDEIIIFGERPEWQLDLCLKQQFTIYINDEHQAKQYHIKARKTGTVPKIHIEIDTGLSRYGVSYRNAFNTIEKIAQYKNLKIEAIMSHFAMSDELDKTYALEQLERFNSVLTQLEAKNIDIPEKQMCNTGGYLDLPMAHFDCVRIGILPLGVYPSKVCRRLEEKLKPIMSVKSRIAVVRDIQKGDKVGYGMHYTADKTKKIGVIPLGYGDGFPRVRNKGYCLIRGKKAPIIGGNAMDAMMADLSDIPNARVWDEVVIMGKQKNESISVHELAAWKNSVSYDILTNWSQRLPRVYLY